jgi:hypothetical protein
MLGYLDREREDREAYFKLSMDYARTHNDGLAVAVLRIAQRTVTRSDDHHFISCMLQLLTLRQAGADLHTVSHNLAQDVLCTLAELEARRF